MITRVLRYASAKQDSPSVRLDSKSHLFLYLAFDRHNVPIVFANGRSLCSYLYTPAMRHLQTCFACVPGNHAMARIHRHRRVLQPLQHPDLPSFLCERICKADCRTLGSLRFFRAAKIYSGPRHQTVYIPRGWGPPYRKIFCPASSGHRHFHSLLPCLREKRR